jgi:hypothetical protein
VALGQVFSKHFGFPCQSTFHQILHHHNHPGQVEYVIQWPTCRVDPVWTPPLTMRIKKNYIKDVQLFPYFSIPYLVRPCVACSHSSKISFFFAVYIFASCYFYSPNFGPICRYHHFFIKFYLCIFSCLIFQ